MTCEGIALPTIYGFKDDAHDAPQDRNTIRLLRAVEGNAIAQMKKILEDGVDLGRRLPGKEVQDTFLLRALELQHEEAALLLLKHKADGGGRRAPLRGVGSLGGRRGRGADDA